MYTVLGDAVAARSKRPTQSKHSKLPNSLYNVKDSLTLRQEHRLKTLKRISGPKKQGVNEAGKECIVKRFIICFTLHQILLR